MKRENWTLEHAYNLIKSLRPSIRPNDGFIKQLTEYEIKLFGQSTLKLQPRNSIFKQCQYCRKYLGAASLVSHENVCKDSIRG